MMKNMDLMVMFHHGRINGLFVNHVGLMVVIIMCNPFVVTAFSSTSGLDDDTRMVSSNSVTSFRTRLGGRRPSATFIFGDSLVDVGMNNHLPASIAKANFLPNGIDFPGRTPTGRFCNGRLISDFLGEHWGMESPLAYTDPANTGEKLLLGANFASAGAGILNDTGFIFIQRFPMSKQVELMGEYVGRLQAMVGETQAANIVSNGFFSITIGANDFLSNYFVPPTSPRKIEFTLPEFHDFLITKLRQQIKQIYGYGARNIIVVGLGPIGCMPVLIGQRFLVDPKGQCIDNFQQVAITFNQKLISMSNELQQELPGSLFLYSNAFNIAMDMIENASSFGFQNVNTACCGRGTQYRSLVPCRPQMKICDDRDSYIFWDPFHPTERVNKIIAQRALFGPSSDISPINLSQLYS